MIIKKGVEVFHILLSYVISPIMEENIRIP